MAADSNLSRPRSTPTDPARMTDPPRPSTQYRLRALAVLAGLIVFLAFYCGLLTGAGYGLYVSALALRSLAGGVVERVVWSGVVVAEVMLFLFLLKGLFKRQHVDRARFVEVTEADEPELFAFLRQLCRQTGTSMPWHVYLCPDANAGVFYDTSLLNVLFPVRKNLLIGLGLVNALNVSEFKAVLAHELGHFSQGSMRLGNYVQIVNHVVQDIVYGRDAWDEALARWRKQPPYIAVFAWIVTGAAWLLRRGLAAVFTVVRALDAALSRQMEFHADAVAVQVAGSDALISALAGTDFANRCMMQTVADLRRAADSGLLTRDVFFHHSRAMEFFRRAPVQSERSAKSQPQPALTEETVRHFETAEDENSVWSTHPSHREREENARRQHVVADVDDRSTWVLFRDPDQVRQALTAHLFATDGVYDTPEFADPERVQQFIDGDYTEMIYDARYRGMYDSRFIELGDVDALASQCRDEPMAHDELASEYARLYGAELEETMDRLEARMEQLHGLEPFLAGTAPAWQRTFEFRGETLPRSAAGEVFQQLGQEMARDREWFAELDGRVFAAHFRMAHDIGAAQAAALLDRYHLHLQLQDTARYLRSAFGAAGNAVDILMTPETDHAQREQAWNMLAQTYTALSDELAEAREIALPAMQNIPAGRRLRAEMFSGELVGPPSDTSKDLDDADRQWFNDFHAQFEEVLDRLSRIRRKSLGGLLAMQEDIAGQWG